MKKFEIYVDAYGPRTSKCFHKIIEAESVYAAYQKAEHWCDTLIDEMGNDFDEFAFEVDGEYTGTDHEVGDCWENEITHNEEY